MYPLLVRNDHSAVARLRVAYGGRRSRINLFDANARRQHASSTGYTDCVAIKIGSRRTKVYLGEELACISTLGNFDLPLLTVNAPDRMGFRSKEAGTVRIGPEKLTLFTEDGSIADIHKRVLDSKEMRTIIAFHSFREGEAIHFYRNGILLYARKDDVNTELIGMLNALANILPPA
jgi:hypothetical protein